jgi:DmsE family decaheme c-type cytochrome
MLRFMSRILRRSSCCSLLLFSGMALGFYTTPLVFAAEKGAACVKCHEQAVESFNSSYHTRILQRKNDCQACHGPTDKHLSDQSKGTIISFSKKGGSPAEELNEKCLECHAKSTKLTFWDMSSHKKNGVTCISCHTIHQSHFVVKQPEVCFGCHRDIRSDANKMSHHPIIEGKVKCSDCHNTHGTLAPHMINAENTNQLCYKCHADKRGPFVWEHPPVEEDCLICHTTHGSRHESLLVERVQNLCQDCHDASSHPGYPNDGTWGFGGRVAGKAPGTVTAGYQARVVGRSCLACHHSIHGSASFRDNAFIR